MHGLNTYCCSCASLLIITMLAAYYNCCQGYWDNCDISELAGKKACCVLSMVLNLQWSRIFLWKCGPREWQTVEVFFYCIKMHEAVHLDRLENAAGHFSELKLFSSDTTCSQLSVNSLKCVLMDMKTSTIAAGQSHCNLVKHHLSMHACVDGTIYLSVLCHIVSAR